MTPQPTAVPHRITIETTSRWARGACSCMWLGERWQQPGGAISASNEAARHLAEATAEAEAHD